MAVTNVAVLLPDRKQEINNLTVGEYFLGPTGTPCMVTGVDMNGTIKIFLLDSESELTCNYDCTIPIPMSGEFLEHNGFLAVDADQRYVKYQRDDKWHTFALIFDKTRKYYSYTEVGCRMPIRSVNQFQRILKQLGYHHAELQENLNIRYEDD